MKTNHLEHTLVYATINIHVMAQKTQMKDIILEDVKKTLVGPTKQFLYYYLYQEVMFLCVFVCLFVFGQTLYRSFMNIYSLLLGKYKTESQRF